MPRIIIPPFLFLICLLTMTLLHWTWPISTLFPFPYNLLGLAPLVAGMAVGFLGFSRFVQVRTNLYTFGEPGKLVTDGIFKYTRNPMYLGLSLLLLGAWMLLGSLSPILGVAVFVLIADRWYIRYEEQQLAKKFGDDFERYRRRTRRWV
jgi:protein-S-isoprenylcysteine O-methyltransferase Ste14